MKHLRTGLLSLFAIAILPPPAASAADADANPVSYRTLYPFEGGTDGADPQGSLVLLNGVLYGATAQGGSSGNGTIYSIDPAAGTESVLFSFGGDNGSFPNAGMVQRKGLLYGTTSYGGSNGVGLVFSFEPISRAQTVLHHFAGPDGMNPFSGLTASGSLLYGATSMGGDQSLNGGIGCGTVFQFDTDSNAYTVLHTFELSDGFGPLAAPVRRNGQLYGTTEIWGTYGSGTVYRIDATTLASSVLYDFAGSTDGGDPWGGVIAVSGMLYGTTTGGGANERGTVYRIDPATGVETVLYSFKGGYDGVGPQGELVYYRGSLYGTTEYGGGPANAGAVYRIDLASGRERVLYGFAGGQDGANPYSGLIESGGVLYGTTTRGGSKNLGTVYALTP